MNTVPRPGKLLVCIASYGTANDKYLARVIQEYKAMSFAVRIVVLSNIEKPVPAGVELVVGLPTPDPWSLPFAHKKVMVEEVADHDLFIYTEDDTVLTEKHIAAFLQASEALPGDQIPGFFRYEEYGERQRNYAELHGHFHWDPASVEIHGGDVFAYMTNEHAACFLITQEQLRACIASGGFDVPPHSVKYDLACTASTDPYTQCGFRKVLCVTRFDEFLIQHLPNKYVGTKFGITERQLRSQLAELADIGSRGEKPASLFDAETKLPDARYSKDYYEASNPKITAQVPASAKTVLSVGCGAGSLERSLKAAGRSVTAVPIDPVISAEAASEGIEMVLGDFASVLQRLDGRSFDCVIFSNVLHLVEDPAMVLNSFGKLLSPSGVAIVLVPKVSRLPNWWKKVSGHPRFQQEVTFTAAGVHATSTAMLKKWFAGAGLSIQKVQNLLPPAAQRLSRLSMGLTDSALADELLVTGTKRN
jgi:2-polyprenyl-3-methyl-5-hydroxy-6-metoxy-1,4-benzoquinol methylase